ncbi:hypothetical protein FB451DRAFT_1168743 [Mycena latifolia]|nr:hypothetical protein FB451DRAFT_1168743 [Mycena latifolia]
MPSSPHSGSPRCHWPGVRVVGTCKKTTKCLGGAPAVASMGGAVAGAHGCGGVVGARNEVGVAGGGAGGGGEGDGVEAGDEAGGDELASDRDSDAGGDMCGDAGRECAWYREHIRFQIATASFQVFAFFQAWLENLLTWVLAISLAECNRRHQRSKYHKNQGHLLVCVDASDAAVAHNIEPAAGGEQETAADEATAAMAKFLLLLMDDKSLRWRDRLLRSLHLQKKAAASSPWHVYSHSLKNQLLFPPDLHKGERYPQADFIFACSVCPPVHSITWGAEIWNNEDDEGPPPLEPPEQSDSIETGLVRGYKPRNLVST